MTHRIFTFALFWINICHAGGEIQVSLVPERALGSRHPDHISFNEVEWSADSPWFYKPAPVCKVVVRPLDLTKLQAEAERRNMIPNPEKLRGGTSIHTADGAIDYVTQERPFVAAGGIRRARYIYFGVMPLNTYERDEHNMAVVEPLATPEESVALFREWMTKLGIDESEFYKHGDWPGGFEVHALTGRASRIHPVTKEKTVALFGQKLRFIQQIGGLPAFWSGFGGCIFFEVGHGGRFCSLMGCLRAWEKIGEYPVLDRAGIEDALHDGFAWVNQPIHCDRIEIVDVNLSAFHSGHDEPQADFPLIYEIRCKLHGGEEDGEEKTICMPALRQHRDQYGPRPVLTEEEIQLRKAIAEAFERRQSKPLEELTGEELEEFKRKWVADGGILIPPPAPPAPPVEE